MFQLLQPIWLYALAGLAVPVIIHLWNQRPGKTLRVGSVALVTENKVSRQKNIHLTELLLLLLRCLLLAAVVLALAGLQWRSNVNNVSKGWVLMPRQQLKTTHQHFKPLVDSLLKTGMEFHYFEDGFQKENIDKALTIVDTSNTRTFYYRNIASSLNEVVDANTPVYIFTDNYLRNFSGPRNTVSLNLHWLAFTPDSSKEKQVADTNAINISVYQKGYANDARYVSAALEAIKQFSKRNFHISNAVSITALPSQQDWLFWLSDESLPQGKNANNILRYAAGKATTCNSYVLDAEGSAFDPLRLYKIVKDTNTAITTSFTKWRDGFGQPLLTLTKEDNNNNYKLFTHVNPSWNELPWSSSFPQLLYQLMYKDAGIKTDNTIIDSTQMLPVIVPEKNATAKHVSFKIINLTEICWLLAFLFFVAERLLSFYQSKTSVYE
ncbi:MAG: BatA domain-containing protein [Chitinophagaceae bacterium]